MAKRKKLSTKSKAKPKPKTEEVDPIYFDYSDAEGKPETFSSGCDLLDLALGGGWAEGRMANLVGDKSTGKTLLAIEACANFIMKHPNGKVRYAEVESAFDIGYARSLGLPEDKIDFFEDCFTVEDLFEDLIEIAKESSEAEPVLYIVDSLDALTDRKEQDTAIDAGTYGMTKQKLLSRLFRQHIQMISASNITLLIVSQVRENIGVTFGAKYRRSGGKALDFYASQIIMIAKLKTIEKTIKGVKRAIGTWIKTKVEKNKIGMPFRVAEYPLIFAYGTDNNMGNMEFLDSVKRLDELGIAKKDIKKHHTRMQKMPDDEYYEEAARLKAATETAWHDIEREFLPKRRKYS